MMHVDPLRPWVSEMSGGVHSTTPAGLQSTATLRWRRRAMLSVCVATYGALLALTGLVLGEGGWSAVDVALFACCACALPWTVMGFWNAVIGLRLLAIGPRGLAAVTPFGGTDADRIRVTTAVVMTLRNEDPARALRRLERIAASLDATGEGEAFAYHVLSDTDDLAVAAAEEQAVAAWRQRHPAAAGRIVYRRRESNTGFKAGNLQDFCRHFAGLYELMLPLDADSAMDGPCILRLVRIMQAHPRIGILQSLVVGLPSPSPFARVFQFGMRQGMRPYTMGAAWWTGDCGPFWGHNALVRMTPFAAHCRLPELPAGIFGGPILSHDQIEAVLMRRAGYEVRVLPVEGGSFEENPPTLFDHVEREARWCFGNLQYVRLMGLRGLQATSRFQLIAAVMMFLTPPALTLALGLLPLKLLELEETFPAGLAAALYLGWLAASIAPKLAGYAETLASRRQSASYGGRAKFILGALVEILFSLTLFSILCFWLTLFMGRRLVSWGYSWGRQNRDLRRLGLGAALRRLWPCFAFGLGLSLWTVALSPAAFLWSLPLLAGPLLCIPLALSSSAPKLGERMAGNGLCSTPEELARSV